MIILILALSTACCHAATSITLDNSNENIANITHSNGSRDHTDTQPVQTITPTQSSVANQQKEQEKPTLQQISATIKGITWIAHSTAKGIVLCNKTKKWVLEQATKIKKKMNDVIGYNTNNEPQGNDHVIQRSEQ